MEERHLEQLSEDELQGLSYNLLDFMRTVVPRDGEVDLAIHPERREVIVFVNGEVVLWRSFEELLEWPGSSAN